MTDTTTITPDERAAWLKEAQPKSVGHYEPIDFEMDKRIRRLLTALEAAEAQLKEAQASVRECEEGWTSHCLEQTQKAPLTKQGRAAWWATIENSVQAGNAAGHSCMMEIHATQVQRFLELIEAAEARAEKAETALLKEEVYSEELESQIQDADGEYNANWAVQAISDVARLVGVLEQCQETGDDIGAAVIEAVQDLKAENARLTAELETARQLGASAHATAQAAWGGEIPSPLPGHKHMTEDDLAAMDAHLDCPLCGGSGHIGDCDATAAGEVARLTAERDWLAKQLHRMAEEYDVICPQEMKCPPTYDCIYCWKEAARRAVADAESVEKVPCPACKGKGGAEYEPGLLSYTCSTCGGSGQIERRAVAAGEG